MGAQVIVTSSSDEKLARAKQLGAQFGINYKTADFPKEVRGLTGKRGVDVVVDCVGGESWMKSLACLARGGVSHLWCNCWSQPTDRCQADFLESPKDIWLDLGDS